MSAAAGAGVSTAFWGELGGRGWGDPIPRHHGIDLSPCCKSWKVYVVERK